MFQILKIGYQNVSVETWMRASKFILKIPWCSEDRPNADWISSKWNISTKWNAHEFELWMFKLFMLGFAKVVLVLFKMLKKCNLRVFKIWITSPQIKQIVQSKCIRSIRKTFSRLLC